MERIFVNKVTKSQTLGKVENIVTSYTSLGLFKNGML
jgi:hypothetical protein